MNISVTQLLFLMALVFLAAGCGEKVKTNAPFSPTWSDSLVNAKLSKHIDTPPIIQKPERKSYDPNDPVDHFAKKALREKKRFTYQSRRVTFSKYVFQPEYDGDECLHYEPYERIYSYEFGDTSFSLAIINKIHNIRKVGYINTLDTFFIVNPVVGGTSERIHYAPSDFRMLYSEIMRAAHTPASSLLTDKKSGEEIKVKRYIKRREDGVLKLYDYYDERVHHSIRYAPSGAKPGEDNRRYRNLPPFIFDEGESSSGSESLHEIIY